MWDVPAVNAFDKFIFHKVSQNNKSLHQIVVGMFNDQASL